ncbi:MAG: ribosome small subunit-dependent GTPase A [Bacteroidia bacterium]
MSKNEYNLINLGFTKYLSDYRENNSLKDHEIGRVTLEHKERFTVQSAQNEIECELIGNLRFTANSRADLPAVGDWVAFDEFDAGKGIIHAIYPRKNVLERQSVGKYGQKQIIGSNIDYGLIVQSVNRDYSINRIERYLTICNSAQIEPIIILNKIDLVNSTQLNQILNALNSRINGVKIFAISNKSGVGIDQLRSLMVIGKTYCLLGSSGVGKSTLINSLSFNEIQKTGAISNTIERGKHITTYRELIVLENGGIIIDNPGMREVGLTENAHGLEVTFEQINELAKQCKFNDCSHQNESGCAVLTAIDAEELSEETYVNYLKLEKEQNRFKYTLHEKRKKDKAFGKMVKQVMKQKHNKR